MNKCKDCSNYDNNNSYLGTGYCHLYEMYVKQDNPSCVDFKDNDN